MSDLWVYVEALAEVREDEVVTLSAEESRHVQTRRLREGASMMLFDGQGNLAEAVLEGTAKKAAVVRAGEVRQAPRPDSEFVLASAVPKGDRLSTMLQMLTQLGTPRWQPLVLEDSAVRNLDPQGPRLRRILIEGCKVARRPWTLDVTPLARLEGVLAEARGPVYYGDREGSAGGLDPATALLVVGPEAGLTGRERELLADAGAQACRLGAHNLRIETAVIAGATAHQLAVLPGPQGNS